MKSYSSPCCARAVRLGGGWIGLAASERGLCLVRLPRPARTEALRGLEGLPAEGVLLDRAEEQLRDYFDGRAVALDVSVDLSALPAFTRKVLETARRIARGERWSYGQLARAVGAPRAARAVGQALHRNPTPLFVPCHRVVGSDGSLVARSPRRGDRHPGRPQGGLGIGFASGLRQKQRLLQLEVRRG